MKKNPLQHLSPPGLINNEQELREALEKLVLQSSRETWVNDDPVACLQRFRNRRDLEIAGWLAAGLAYGRRELFIPVLHRLFELIGNRPLIFLRYFQLDRDGPLFEELRYRFNNGWDLAFSLAVLQQVYREHRDLQDFFLNWREPGQPPDVALLTGPLRQLRQWLGSLLIRYPELAKKTRNPWYLYPDPAAGSCMKRTCLFLRWMVRSRPPDTGLWRDVPPDGLVIPLDVHVLRISRQLGLTGRKNPSLDTAREITAVFRRLSPGDPLRYDFPLAALGAGICPAGEGPCRHISGPGTCPLASLCRRRSPS